jgi:hypothetical protein
MLNRSFAEYSGLRAEAAQPGIYYKWFEAFPAEKLQGMFCLTAVLRSHR